VRGDAVTNGGNCSSMMTIAQSLLARDHQFSGSGSISSSCETACGIGRHCRRNGVAGARVLRDSDTATPSVSSTLSGRRQRRRRLRRRCRCSLRPALLFDEAYFQRLTRFPPTTNEDCRICRFLQCQLCRFRRTNRRLNDRTPFR